VSLATDTDHNREPTKQAAGRLRADQRPIILPTDVFVETVNVLGKQSGHQTALKAAVELRQSDGQFVLVETAWVIEAALEKFEKLPEGVSLTDCIVMTIADYYGTKDIFGFDKQFEDAGYGRHDPSTEWREAA
jgi:predicted nucleic acid-binding protein